MNNYPNEVFRRRNERMRKLTQVKTAIVQSVLLRIHEEQARDPDVTEIHTPLLRENEFATQMLRHHPEEIAAKVIVGRTIKLVLDESVEPPELVITLGEIE